MSQKAINKSTDFVWAKLKGTVVKWPVRVTMRSQKNVLVFVKSNHAE